MNVLVVVDAVHSRVDPVPPSSRTALLERFTLEVEHAYFARKARPGWDGKIRYFAADGSFLTGFLPEVTEILEADGHQLTYRDDRAAPPRRRMGPCLVRLRDYQARVVADALAVGVRCTIKAATNAGKSECAIVLAHRLGVRTLVLTPGVDLAIQTRERFARALPKAGIGLVTGDALRGITLDEGTGDADVVVANVQGLSAKTRLRVPARRRGIATPLPNSDSGATSALRGASRRQGATVLGPFTPAGLRFLATFGFVVGDEVDVALTAGEHGKLLDRCPARYRLALSATPDTGDACRDALRVGHFGEVVAEVSQTFLRDEGHSASVTVRVLPYAVPERLASPSWPRQRAWLIRNGWRNVAITAAVTTEARAGFRCLIVVDRYAHAYALGDTLGVDWHFISGSNRAERVDMLDDFRAGRIRVIVATSVFNRGIDLKEIDRLVIAACGAEARLGIQQGGRLVRFREDKDAVLYLPRDEKLYDERVVPPRQRFLEAHYRTTLAALRGEGFAVEGEK